MYERRHYFRWQVESKARLQLDGRRTPIDCNLLDISPRGAKIYSVEKLNKDTALGLRLAISADCVLEVRAWVAWSKCVGKGHTYGFYFSGISQQDRDKVCKLSSRFLGDKIKKQWSYEKNIKKGGENMEDRRIFERFHTGLSMRFLSPSKNEEEHSMTRDISAKGVSFDTDEQINPRTPVEIWLEIPDQAEPVYTRGEVAWSKMFEPNKYRIGVDLEKANLMDFWRIIKRPDQDN